jgi:uncharacterized protein YqjF (DUF2071 family)
MDVAASWRDLLFLHWPVPAAALRPLVPAELTIEEVGGTSWVQARRVGAGTFWYATSESA